MGIVYVFAENIRDLVLEGKQEITVPADARISAAAWDLIREKQVKVIFSEPEPDKVPADPSGPDPAPVPAGDESRESERAGRKAATAEIRARVTEAVSEIDEEDMEAIIDRVLARLEQVKRTPAADSGGPAANDGVDEDLVICRCEEITRGEIKQAIRNGMTSLSGIKRVTRAGMGLCQGQTCQELVMRLLAEELGVKPHELEPITARGPVRPLRLDVFARS